MTDAKWFLPDWAKRQKALSQHNFCTTGTIDLLLGQRLRLPIQSMISRPLGGDQQVGARSTEQQIDMPVFVWNAIAPQLDDSDIEVLLKIAASWNIPVACDKSRP